MGYISLNNDDELEELINVILQTDNSSLGSQWKYRIDSVDEQVRSFATTMTEEERNSTYLNVKLIYGGQ